MLRTAALVAVTVVTVVVVPVGDGPGEATDDPCTSAFYWRHRDCPLPALVALDDIEAVTGVDVIPPIDRPRFGSVESAASWLSPESPLLVVTVDDQTRAYPLAILMWHEVVNDHVTGTPLLVTYCPLCNSGLVFDRRVRGPDGEVQVLDFGTSGHLYRSNLVLYDRQHENFWLQLSGTAVAGEPHGTARTELDRIAADLLGLDTLRELAPDARVLTRDTGVERDYGRNPYWGYDRPDSRPFLYDEGPVDDRLPPMTRVVGFTGPPPVAVTEDRLREQRVLELGGDGGPVTVWWAPGQSSALETARTAEGRDVGQVVAFEAELERVGRLDFVAGPSPSRFVDEQTGTRWNLLGEAEDGPLAGRRLTPAPHDVTFWFAWYAFHPDTSLEPDPQSSASATR